MDLNNGPRKGRKNMEKLLTAITSGTVAGVLVHSYVNIEGVLLGLRQFIEMLGLYQLLLNTLGG